MGKGDAKKDYYAALGVAPNADLDTIKKRFRVLALQVHPDRNFGKGKEVTEKFVEVQEAYEVLSDQEQRAKYDTDRAKYLRKTQPDAFPFKRAQTAKVPPQNAAFQPTPKSRNASVDRSQFTSPRTKQSSASAEKFAAFTRAAPQTWDRVKFEQAAAQQEVLRNFQSMRSQATQQSSRAGRAPTAPKTTNPVTSPDYAQPSMPSPGFPGLSRTHSTSRRQGFSPAVPGDDEPQAKSAYAYVNRDRDNTRSYHNATPQPPTPTSPAYSNMRTGSPLKPSRSSPGLDDGQRPTFGRSPSRYASTTGERTNINGVGIGRSASVRQSPVDRGLGERGPFGARAQASQEFMPPPPRHHSASPKLRPARDVRFQFSASESSSSGDDVAPPEPRRMAKPRRPRPPPAERATSNDPALMGQFTDKNYNRVVDENQYNFPPPEMSSAPHVQSPRERQNSWTDIADGMRATGLSNHDQEFPKPRRPSSSLHESSRGSPSRYENHPAPFRASEWDGKFADGENVFTPNERDRKSPTKNSRSRQPGKSREPPSEVYGDEDNVSPTTVPGNHPSSEAPSRNTTSSKGPFSMDGWAENLTSTGSTNTPPATASENAAFGGNFQGEGNVKESRSASMPDPMDIDSNGPESTREIPSIKVQPSSRRASAQGVDLSDLADTFPLKPSADGLNSLSSDLASSLPFKSRPAEQVQLFGPSGAALRGMSLPKPPKPIIAPEQEQITQESWESYWKKMQQYMRDWSAFNTKMIDHFRWRQEQVDHDMYRNWVMGEGEGANAQDMDGSDITSPPGSSAGDHPHKHVKAGYHTYMQWLEQDALCRNWWDAAVEEHRECLTELGRMRRTVKAIRDRQGGPD